MSRDPWQVLGIAPSRDLREIKRAYAVTLKKHRPDDDAEGYQLLRSAYEWALDWARYAPDDATSDALAAPTNVEPEAPAVLADPDDIHHLSEITAAPTAADALAIDEDRARADRIYQLLCDFDTADLDGLARCWAALDMELLELSLGDRDTLSPKLAQFVAARPGFPPWLPLAFARRLDWAGDFRGDAALDTVPELRERLKELLVREREFLADWQVLKNLGIARDSGQGLLAHLLGWLRHPRFHQEHARLAPGDQRTERSSADWTQIGRLLQAVEHWRTVAGLFGVVLFVVTAPAWTPILVQAVATFWTLQVTSLLVPFWVAFGAVVFSLYRFAGALPGILRGMATFSLSQIAGALTRALPGIAHRSPFALLLVLMTASCLIALAAAMHFAHVVQRGELPSLSRVLLAWTLLHGASWIITALNQWLLQRVPSAWQAREALRLNVGLSIAIGAALLGWLAPVPLVVPLLLAAVALAISHHLSNWRAPFWPLWLAPPVIAYASGVALPDWVPGFAAVVLLATEVALREHPQSLNGEHARDFPVTGFQAINLIVVLMLLLIPTPMAGAFFGIFLSGLSFVLLAFAYGRTGAIRSIAIATALSAAWPTDTALSPIQIWPLVAYVMAALAMNWRTIGTTTATLIERRNGLSG